MSKASPVVLRTSFPVRLIRLMIGLSVPPLAKCEPDKSEHHQDGSGYYHPMGIFQLGQHASFPFRFQAPSNSLIEN